MNAHHHPVLSYAALTKPNLYVLAAAGPVSTREMGDRAPAARNSLPA